MGWLDRPRRDVAAAVDEEHERPGRAERRAPALAALFERIHADRRHSILDFGVASTAHLRFLGRYARTIRFAGFVPDLPPGTGWRVAISTLPALPTAPYDAVLAWDLLDRTPPELRGELMARLAEVTAPGALLYAVVHGGRRDVLQPVRTTLLGHDRLMTEPVGAPEAASPPLLPAPLERLVAPFGVVQAFTLRSGEREYLVRKG